MPYELWCSDDPHIKSLYFTLQKQHVEILSKWDLNTVLNISDLRFIDRYPLVRRVNSNHKGEAFLINREWLDPIPIDKSGRLYDDSIDLGVNGCKREAKIFSGGEITLVGGRGGSHSPGGEVTISAGRGGGGGHGGAIMLSAGQAATKNGDFNACDGTKRLHFDASVGKLEMTEYRKTKKTQLDKPKKISWKREKLLLKQHTHANQCVLKENTRRSHERVDITLSRHKVYQTFIRCVCATVTILGSLYMIL